MAQTKVCAVSKLCEAGMGRRRRGASAAERCPRHGAAHAATGRRTAPPIGRRGSPWRGSAPPPRPQPPRPLPPTCRVRGGAAGVGGTEVARPTRQPVGVGGGWRRRSAPTNRWHTARDENSGEGWRGGRSCLPPTRVPEAVLLAAMAEQRCAPVSAAAAAVGPRCGRHGRLWRLPRPARASLGWPTAGGSPAGGTNRCRRRRRLSCGPQPLRQTRALRAATRRRRPHGWTAEGR